MPRSLVCSACPSKIRDGNYITCKSEECGKTFHLLCTSVASKYPARKETWICPDCQAATKKGGDNSTTPIRAQVVVTENVAFHNQLGAQERDEPKILAPSEDGLQALTSEIRMLRQEMLALKTDLCDAVTSLTRCHERLDDVTAQFAISETRLKELEAQKTECILLRAKVTDLENTLNNQAQLGLKNEVELLGVPECGNENLNHVLLVTATTIGVSLTDLDIDTVTRTGPRRTAQDSHGGSSDHNGHTSFSRPVVARFCRKSKRDEFLKAARLRRNLTSKSLNMDGPEQKIFVNERLTRTNRLLFRETRLRSRGSGYKHCWIRNGTIFVRKQDQDGKSRSPPIVIHSERDLDDLFATDKSDKA